jgi:hypothetical protein
LGSIASTRHHDLVTREREEISLTALDVPVRRNG